MGHLPADTLSHWWLSTHFQHLFFLYGSPQCHIKFLRPCCLCLLSLMFSLQSSFKLMFKLPVNLTDGHLLPSLISKHNKSHQLCRIQEDSKYPARLLEWLNRWDDATHLPELQPDILHGCQTLTHAMHKQDFWATDQTSPSGHPSHSTDFWSSGKKFLHSLTQTLDSASFLPKKETVPERHRRCEEKETLGNPGD